MRRKQGKIHLGGFLAFQRFGVELFQVGIDFLACPVECFKLQIAVTQQNDVRIIHPLRILGADRQPGDESFKLPAPFVSVGPV